MKLHWRCRYSIQEQLRKT